MQRTGNLLRPFARPPIAAKTLRSAGGPDGGCPHRLGQHLTRAARSTQTYPDGATRPAWLRGGRLVVNQLPCVRTVGHPGLHETAAGRTWP